MRLFSFAGVCLMFTGLAIGVCAQEPGQPESTKPDPQPPTTQPEPVAPPAPTMDPKVKALLDTCKDAYSKVTNISATSSLVVKGTTAEEDGMNSSGGFTLSAPNKFRWEWKSKAGEYLAVSDGVKLWLLNKTTKQYLEKTAPSREQIGMTVAMEMVPLGEDLNASFLLGATPLDGFLGDLAMKGKVTETETVDGVLMDVITSTEANFPPGVTTNKYLAKLYIGAVDHLLYGVRLEMDAAFGAEKMVMEAKYSSAWNTTPTVADDTFKFAAPAGVKKVTTFRPDIAPSPAPVKKPAPAKAAKKPTKSPMKKPVTAKTPPAKTKAPAKSKTPAKKPAVSKPAATKTPPAKAVEVTTASGLKYTDTVVGKGDAVKTGDTVSVHYTGTFTDGKKFDSSKDRNEPFQFTVGARSVIPGWDEGLVGMKVGGTRKLVVPPQLGYGPNDYGPIPGNSTLHFNIELLAIK